MIGSYVVLQGRKRHYHVERLRVFSNFFAIIPTRLKCRISLELNCWGPKPSLGGERKIFRYINKTLRERISFQFFGSKKKIDERGLGKKKKAGEPVDFVLMPPIHDNQILVS